MTASRSFRYVNLVVNVLVILTVTLLVGLIAHRIFLQLSNSVEPSRLIAGETFNELPEVDFNKTPHTILIATNAKCRYCTQSIPFYKKLIAKAEDTQTVQTVALFSNKREEVENYLREHNFAVEFIPNVDLVKLKVDATPTIIWVDSNRKIVGSYQGMLQEKQELSFLEAFQKKLSGN